MTNAAQRKRAEQHFPHGHEYYEMHCRTCGQTRKHKIVIWIATPPSKFGWCMTCFNYNEWSKRPDNPPAFKEWLA